MRVIACTSYGYDTFVKGKYKLTISDDISIDVFLPKVYLESEIHIFNLLNQKFPSTPRFNYEVQAILYFLNLQSFHTDSIERSLGFYYWGTLHLNRWFKKNEKYLHIN